MCVYVDSSEDLSPNLLRGRSTWGEAPLEKSGSDRAECKIQVCRPNRDTTVNSATTYHNALVNILCKANNVRPGYRSDLVEQESGDSDSETNLTLLEWHCGIIAFRFTVGDWYCLKSDDYA